MSQLPDLALEIRRGASIRIPIRVETDVLRFVAIVDMSRSAPIRITAPNHGLLDGWRTGVMNAGGMVELNAEWNNLQDSSMYKVVFVDSDTVELSGINSSGFRTYTSGGQLAYYEPLDLSQFTSARMDVKVNDRGSALASYSTTAGTLKLDLVNSALWLVLTPVESSALAAKVRVFDIEMVRADGSVFPLCSAKSALTVLPEITTSA